MSLLQRDPPARVPRDLWQEMGLGAGLDDGFLERQLATDRAGLRRFDPDGAYWDRPAGELADLFWLSSVINEQLEHSVGGPRLSVRPDLRLAIEPGLGALRAAWLLLAQAASRDRAAYVCGGCGAPYVRPVELRAPKSSARNYCAACGGEGGYRSAKKLSNQARRSKLRALVAFAEAAMAAQNWEGDWGRVHAAWNEAHPSDAYATLEVFRADLRDKTRAYGVALGRLAAFVDGHTPDTGHAGPRRPRK